MALGNSFKAHSMHTPHGSTRGQTKMPTMVSLDILPSSVRGLLAKIYNADDNAQVAIAFLRAYELGLSDKAMYLTQAQKVIDFLSGGWDETNGGVIWHYGDTGRNAVTTSLTAVAMLRLVKLGQVTPGMSKSQLTAFATKCIEWVLTELQVDSGLIKDGPNDAQIYTYVGQILVFPITLLTEIRIIVTILVLSSMLSH
jgi:predicted alpha-1,6-mannanase (GH76 family)